MNATELLAELRPPLETSPTDDPTLERILLASAEPPRAPRTSRYRRPLAVASATVIAATAAVALVPTGENAPVGLERAIAALNKPQTLLHFSAETTHLPSGATERAETWQTPDGRRMRIRRGDVETAYDQRAGVSETYVPERRTVLVDTDPDLFGDEDNPFGSIATSVPSNPVVAGDLPALLKRALGGEDPNVRRVGSTTIDGVDVEHIRIEGDAQTADGAVGAAPPARDSARTVKVTRDVYVRGDNALPVRVVDHLGNAGTSGATTSVTEFTGAEILELNSSTERTLKLNPHPGAERTVRGAFDDSSSAGR
jgi:hypothetical protein